MISRIDKFHSFASHAWFKRHFAKLSTSDFNIIHSFLNDNRHLGRDDFEAKVNRMFLDNPEKPKRWQIIIELLSNSNS